MKSYQSKVLLVGGGFSGIAGAITLKDHFKTDDFIIYDRNEDIGGTWWTNTYPGCASDVPAMFYSLSTDLNPNWSDLTPPQAEMQKYLKHVVEKRGFQKHFSFQKEVQYLDWDEENAVWRSEIKDLVTGEVFEHVSKLVFVGQGLLVHPNKMNFPGLKDGTFKGEYFHTAKWDHNVSLKDKKVVVIGNGCTATQVVPAILDETKSVTQVIRSKHYIVPRPEPSVFRSFKRFFSRANFLMKIFRTVMFFTMELKAPLFNGENPLAKFSRMWFTRKAKNYMKAKTPEKYHDTVIPDYKIGCKRMILDCGYLESLNRDDLHLVNGDIDYISEDAVHTKSGEDYPADVIIAATGYDINKGALSLNVRGQDKSETLSDRWVREGVAAYETTMVDQFPNMFFFAGPNSATGHSSVILAIENAQLFVKKVAAPVLNDKARYVTVKSEAYNKWRATVSKALEKSVFSTPYGGCTSWYGEGPGGNFLTYPWTQITYWYHMKYPNLKDMEYV